MEEIRLFAQGRYSFLLFVIFFCVVIFTYLVIVRIISKYVLKTTGVIDDTAIKLLKVPILGMICWLLCKLYYENIFDSAFHGSLNQISSIVFIVLMAWIFIRANQILALYFQNKLSFTIKNNLNARSRLTQIKVFQRIINSLIIVLAISISLLTFEKARTLGISILTSAGIAGVILGLAAQRSLSMIFAGVQIAITQPIRLDDVVIVEGEWGNVEEITLTYVVINIWDQRRLILPVNYFLEKPFQNWTRKSSEILGTVFLKVDYNFPVDEIRKMLDEILEGNTDWDKRVANVQVTNLDDKGKEIRILVSSSDSSRNWDLRTYIREKIVQKINSKVPDAFVKYRLLVDA
jgi:small-conductance mechanosensitive channel